MLPNNIPWSLLSLFPLHKSLYEGYGKQAFLSTCYSQGPFKVNKNNDFLCVRGGSIAYLGGIILFYRKAAQGSRKGYAKRRSAILWGLKAYYRLSAIHIFGFVILVSFLAEMVFPLFTLELIADPWDVCFYVLGGFTYALVQGRSTRE